MSHAIIVGRTGTGKTTLAVQIMHSVLSRYPVLACDPKNDGRWEAAHWTTRTAYSLQLAMKASRGPGFVFIDEAPRALGWSNSKQARQLSWITSEARAWGWKVHLIGQRYTALDRTAREQCADAYVFRLGAGDAKMIAEELACPALAQASELEPGEYLAFRSIDPNAVVKATIF